MHLAAHLHGRDACKVLTLDCREAKFSAINFCVINDLKLSCLKQQASVISVAVDQETGSEILGLEGLGISESCKQDATQESSHLRGRKHPKIVGLYTGWRLQSLAMVASLQANPTTQYLPPCEQRSVKGNYRFYNIVRTRVTSVHCVHSVPRGKGYTESTTSGGRASQPAL